MRICKYCGRQIEDYQIICPHCGGKQDMFSQNQNTQNQNGYNSGYNNNGYYNNNQNGYNQNNNYIPYVNIPNVNTSEKLCFWVAALCFLLPPLAIVFYFVYRYKDEGKKQSAIKGAISPFCVGFPLFGIIAYFLIGRSFPEYKNTVKISSIAGFIFKAVIYLVISLTALFGGFDGITPGETPNNITPDQDHDKNNPNLIYEQDNIEETYPELDIISLT